MPDSERRNAKHIPAADFEPMMFGDHIRFRRHQARTVSLACIEMSAGGESPHHRHPDEQVVMLVEGRLEAVWGDEENEQRVEMTAGDLFIVPPMTLHQIRALDDSLFFEAFGPPDGSLAETQHSAEPDENREITSSRVTFIDHSGIEQEVVANAGESLMQAARRNGIEGIVAICGGNGICGTCQVYLEERDLERFGVPDSKESSMLSRLENAAATSRLACQIKVSSQTDGLRVRTPEKQLRATQPVSDARGNL